MLEELINLLEAESLKSFVLNGWQGMLKFQAIVLNGAPDFQPHLYEGIYCLHFDSHGLATGSMWTCRHLPSLGNWGVMRDQFCVH